MSQNVDLNNTLNLINLLEKYKIFLPSNILYNISINMSNSSYLHKHISLLIDIKEKQVITYGFNYYLKSNKFPYSLHSEINTINKHYKKKLIKPIMRSKKILVILKISKTGIIGCSKPCQNCANYIYNNFDNLNLINVLYSTKENILESLSKIDLLNDDFKISAGFKKNPNKSNNQNVKSSSIEKHTKKS